MIMEWFPYVFFPAYVCAICLFVGLAIFVIPVSEDQTPAPEEEILKRNKKGKGLLVAIKTEQRKNIIVHFPRNSISSEEINAEQGHTEKSFVNYLK